MVSFCHERFRPLGGPDGGDGGRGGDVILYLDRQLSSLEHITDHKQYAAGDGSNGKKSKRHGAAGSDCAMPLPAGTMVRAEGERQPLCEITERTPRHVVLTGGRGGFGNTKFKTAHNRAPKFAQSGGEAQSGQFELELRLIADIGLVGMPNAGKSSLLRALSRAMPAVGDYPFTSLIPTLGVIEPPLPTLEPLMAIDVPGIIGGAADGHGLGNRFLRHLSRVAMIVLVLSLESIDGADARAQLRLLCRELQAYDAALLDKTALIVANKHDIPRAREALTALDRGRGEAAGGAVTRAAETATGRHEAGDALAAGIPIVDCSATEGSGVAALVAALYRIYDERRK